MLKRIIHFKKDDWKHIGWLLKTIVKNFAKGDLNEFIEGFYFIKLHLCHDSKKLTK